MTRQADAEDSGKGGGDAEEAEMYTARVTERNSIVVRFRVRNLGERAFLAKGKNNKILDKSKFKIVENSQLTFISKI
jgi:3-deoxy-D-manno-octulosonate 8-phosphate phosphatase KdsC-like HAD superfamily phosphatase